jgi:hypothetical protein
MVRVETYNSIVIEVGFDEADREDGFDDEIYVSLSETGPKTTRILASDETRFLLTCEEALQIAAGLEAAVAESRRTPR